MIIGPQNRCSGNPGGSRLPPLLRKWWSTLLLLFSIFSSNLLQTIQSVIILQHIYIYSSLLQDQSIMSKKENYRNLLQEQKNMIQMTEINSGVPIAQSQQTTNMSKNQVSSQQIPQSSYKPTNPVNPQQRNPQPQNNYRPSNYQPNRATQNSQYYRTQNTNSQLYQVRDPYSNNYYGQARIVRPSYITIQNSYPNRQQTSTAKIQKIPQMQVACNYCTIFQIVPSTAQLFKCYECRSNNQCEPLYGLFACERCHASVCYPYGVSELMKCTKCGTVNRVLTEPSRPKKPAQKVEQTRNKQRQQISQKHEEEFLQQSPHMQKQKQQILEFEDPPKPSPPKEQIQDDLI